MGLFSWCCVLIILAAFGSRPLRNDLQKKVQQKCSRYVWNAYVCEEGKGQVHKLTTTGSGRREEGREGGRGGVWSWLYIFLYFFLPAQNFLSRQCAKKKGPLLLLPPRPAYPPLPFTLKKAPRSSTCNVYSSTHYYLRVCATYARAIFSPAFSRLIFSIL